MKLNPPASSSDLELARQIARRLHQNRRRDDPAAAGWPGDEAPARPRLNPPPLPRPAPTARAQAADLDPIEPPRVMPPSPPPPPAPPARPAPPPPAPAPFQPELEPPEPSFGRPEPSFGRPEPDAYERPGWSEPAVEEDQDPAERTIADEDDDRAPLEDLASPEEPQHYAAEPAAPPEPELPDVAMDVETDEEPALSPEEMVGEAEPEGSPLDQLTEPDDSPFDDALLDAPPAAEEEPETPSWDDIVESCRDLAAATGAMLIDPAGQVFAARGDWPAPGPEQIAGKLVAMMAKTLKDAPTRSISAPLMGKHLTAWRVPISEGLMTVAFIGAAPVRADARPGIDAQVLSGVRS